MIALARAGAVLCSAVAMLALLLGLAAVAAGRPEGAAVYLAVTILASVAVAAIMRSDMRRRRQEEALLPPERRPARRRPRRPIVVPLREGALTFAAWYAVAVGVDIVVTGTTSAFTLAAVAPFAALMLTTLTVAGRHMMFRLTAEDAEAADGTPAASRDGADAPSRR